MNKKPKDQHFRNIKPRCQYPYNTTRSYINIYGHIYCIGVRVKTHVLHEIPHRRLTTLKAYQCHTLHTRQFKCSDFNISNNECSHCSRPVRLFKVRILFSLQTFPVMPKIKKTMKVDNLLLIAHSCMLQEQCQTGPG